MDWDVNKIFEDHGGANDLCARLVAGGHDVNVRAVRQWHRRQNIPPVWLARILKMGEFNHDYMLTAWIAESSELQMEDIF